MKTILILLNVCHWLADFTHLSTDKMLAAKRKGMPLLPILNHAGIHGALMGLVLAVYLKGSLHTMAIVFLAMGFETATHFIIDVLKGRLNVWYPQLANPANKFHWYIFGVDQFLHQMVIIIIAYYVTF